MKLAYSLFLVTLMTTGCLTRAPTDYELDRRSGLTPPGGAKERSVTELQKLGAVKSEVRPSLVPVRRAARVEKIWVFDQTIENRVLQHTWLFVEVDKGGWTTSERVQEPAPQESTSPTLLKTRK